MAQQQDLLLDILTRVAGFKAILDESAIKYKIIGLRLHPKYYLKLKCYLLAHSIFETNMDTLGGFKIILDHNIEDEKDVQIVMELPKHG